MVAGGWAAVIYGYPRMTLDIDLIVRLSADEGNLFGRLWPSSDFSVLPPQECYAP